MSTYERNESWREVRDVRREMKRKRNIDFARWSEVFKIGFEARENEKRKSKMRGKMDKNEG